MEMSFGLGFWATMMGSLVALVFGSVPHLFWLDFYFAADHTGVMVRLEPIFVVRLKCLRLSPEVGVIATFFNLVLWDESHGLLPPTLHDFLQHDRIQWLSTEWFAFRIMQHELVHVRQFRCLGPLTYLAVLDPDYEAKEPAFFFEANKRKIGISAPELSLAPCGIVAGFADFVRDCSAWATLVLWKPWAGP